MTTPSFRAINSALASDTTGVTVTIPASTQVGDLLLFTIASTGGNPTTPSGWTSLGTVTGYDGTYYNSQYAFWRIAESGDAGTNVTFSIASGTSYFAGAISAWADAHRVAGNDTFSGSTSSTQIEAPAVAVPAAQSLTVTTFAHTSASGNPSITAPNTEHVDHETAGLRQVVSSDTSDPNATRTATIGSSVNSRTAFTIVLSGGSVVKVWTGAAWEQKPLYRWDGTDWAPTVLKRWDGSAWQEV